MNKIEKQNPNESLSRADGGPKRARFQGVLQIVRFNWPHYLAAAGAIALLLALLRFVSLPMVLRVLAGVGIFLAAFWTLSSLMLSHWVHDCVGIYSGDWIEQALPKTPARWVNLHAGFDEFTLGLRALFPESRGAVWDFQNGALMTEPSIVRARRMATGAPRPLKVNYAALPEPDGTLDAAFLIFAAHEIRSRRARDQLFHELLRILRRGGSLLLVEHLRDWTNFLGFGFGAFHFLSRHEWMRAADGAGFKLEREFSITPFVWVFLFRRSV
jgi:SAM-dependent methyltransferase